MNKKQKGIFIILVLMASVLCVAIVISVGGNGDPPDEFIDSITYTIGTSGTGTLENTQIDDSNYKQIDRVYVPYAYQVDILFNIDPVYSGRDFYLSCDIVSACPIDSHTMLSYDGGTIATGQIINFDDTLISEVTFIRLWAWHPSISFNVKVYYFKLVEVGVPPPPPEIPDSPVISITVNKPSTDGEIILEWDPVSNADDYAVYRTKNDGSLDFLEEINVNYYTDSVTESGFYSYKVRAENEAGKSDFSNEVSIVVQLEGIPEAPFMNQLTYEIIGDTIKVYLDWEDVECDSYNLYKQSLLTEGLSHSGFLLIEEGITSTSYSEVLIEVGVYSYKVSAVNMFGESERSAYVSIEITEDGVPDEPPEPDDYTVITIVVILVLAVLSIPTVILVKRKKR